jgi:hypothetical protein
VPSTQHLDLMSASGCKRTFKPLVIYVRFTPESGHSEGSSKESAYDPKRTISSRL